MSSTNILEERLTKQKQQAVLIRLVSLGTATGEFEGKSWSRPQLYAEFELPEIKRKTGAPFTIGRVFTHSIYEKSHLRKFLADWLGEETLQGKHFFLKDLLGLPAEIQITTYEKGDKIKFTIGEISPIDDEQKTTRTHYDPIYFELDSVFDEFTYSMLPIWMKDKIAASPEYKRFHKS